MPDDYAYAVAQCDIALDKRGALQSYRGKRRLWLSWIDTDEHHAVWRVLASMIWSDVSFKTLTQFAVNDEDNALNNTLLGQALIDGHVATQVPQPGGDIEYATMQTGASGRAVTMADGGTMGLRIETGDNHERC